MKRHIVGCLMFAAGLGGVQAVAADLPQTYDAVEEAVAVPPSRFYWVGFYFGGTIGGTNAQRRTTGAATGAFDTTRIGVSGGVHAGYNYMLSPNFLVGAEADVSFADIAKRSSPNGIAVRTNSDWISTLRGRAGWTFDRFLVYGTGGLALADVNWKSAGGSDSKTVVGWTVGAGVEGALTERVTARVEYLYTDFGSERFNLGANSVKSDLDTHTARVGLSYKF